VPGFRLVSSLEKDLTSQGYSLHTWSNGPGAVYSVHEHPYNKIIVCMRGSITFHLPAKNKAVAMKAGDRLELAAGTAHSAVVGGEGVTCLEGQRQ
jgi:quercetin dioxygenase-like cupin family protein